MINIGFTDTDVGQLVIYLNILGRGNSKRNYVFFGFSKVEMKDLKPYAVGLIRAGIK